MCRMIAAAGEVDPSALLEALRRMAANENPAHTHERRPRGADFRHVDGWGAAWVENGSLRTCRRPRSILEDGDAERTLAGLSTRLFFIHARRASRGRPVLRNTHPFALEYLGRSWAFCHNGTVDGHDALLRVPGLQPRGGTDSEYLFHHLLNRIGARYDGDLERALAPSVLEGLARLESYTAAHCFLATNDRILAAAARHPQRSQPEYHALWEGRGPGRRVVSSEPVDGLDCSWERMPEPGVITLEEPS